MLMHLLTPPLPLSVPCSQWLLKMPRVLKGDINSFVVFEKVNKNIDIVLKLIIFTVDFNPNFQHLLIMDLCALVAALFQAK